MYAMPNWKLPNQIALNQTVRSQTKTCICQIVICRQHGQSPLPNFLKKHNILEASSISICMQRSPNLVDPSDWCALIPGNTETV